MATVSIRKAAHKLGVTHPALLKAIKAGSLQRENDGGIDLKHARKSEWWRNREGKILKPKPQPLRKESRKKRSATLVVKQSVPAPKQNDDLEQKRQEIRKKLEDMGVMYPEMFAQDKIALEKLLILERREALRLKNEESRGNLLKSSQVENVWLKIGNAIRGRLLLLPGKLCAHLVGIDDAQRIRRMLEVEIRESLTVLSEMRINAA